MSLEGENEMKRLTLLLTMLPLVTLADVPSPTYIHRLHRVGYEILPVAGLNAWLERNLLVVGIVLGALFTGLMVLFFLKNDSQSQVRRFLKPISRTLQRYEIHVSYSIALLISGIVMYYVFYPSVKRTMEAMNAAVSGGPVHVEESGWKYRDELTEREMSDYRARIAALPPRLYEQIEAEWKKDSSNGSEEHAKEVVTTVLNADHELLCACMALPLELIVDRYFTTERWYDMGRHSFIHPRNVPWSQSEYEAKTVQRTTKETSLTSGDENRK